MPLAEFRHQVCRLIRTGFVEVVVSEHAFEPVVRSGDAMARQRCRDDAVACREARVKSLDGGPLKQRLHVCRALAVGDATGIENPFEG